MPKEVDATFAIMGECTPVLSASPAYTAGDLLFNATKMAGITRKPYDNATIRSITVIDKDSQGKEMDLHFFSGLVDMGTVNSAPSTSATDSEQSLGWATVAAADWKDIGDAKVGIVKSLLYAMPFPLAQSDENGDIYVAAITAGTPTHSVNGLIVKVGFFQG